MSDVDEKLPGNGEAEAELRAGLIAMTADLAGVYDLLVLADAEGAQALEPLGATLLACALVVKVDRSGTINDPGAHAMMKAGEPALTWCSAGPDGREVARRLHDAVPNLRHIVTMEPASWHGAPQLADLVDGASSTKPPAIRRTAAASNGSTASSSHEPPPVPPDALDGSPAKLAARIILRYGADLLVVDDGDYGTGYALDASTGIWRAGGEVWARWLIEIADTMTAEIIGLGLTARALTTAIAHVHRLKRPGMVEQIRPMLRAVLGYLRDRSEKCANVTECHADEIDANTRYFGTASGVVDLYAGELLPPETGRAALVTWQTAVEFDPAAQHSDVDRLFEHLDPAAVGWWWRVLGFHLLGAPSRRFYVVVGPPSGGKTTLANAIAGTLGPYASRPADGALEARTGGSAGLSPELEAFTAPRRWAIIDEAPRMTIAAPLLKRLSGDTSQTFRRLHEQLRTVPATATVLVICNPGSVPKLRLQDEAMADRLRELPYPAVPSPDSRMKHTIETPEFRRAFLARLVAAAAAETPREPPADVPVVRAATDERVREDVGELGAFACRIVRGADTLTVADVWAAWCEHNEEPTDATEAGGIAKRRLSTALRDHVETLPAARPYSEAGRKVRGWRGWRLLSVGGAEATPQVNRERRESLERWRKMVSLWLEWKRNHPSCWAPSIDESKLVLWAEGPPDDDGKPTAIPMTIEEAARRRDVDPSVIRDEVETIAAFTKGHKAFPRPAPPPDPDPAMVEEYRQNLMEQRKALAGRPLDQLRPTRCRLCHEELSLDTDFRNAAHKKCARDADLWYDDDSTLPLFGVRGLWQREFGKTCEKCGAELSADRVEYGRCLTC